MNVHISYKAGKTPDVEREFNHQVEKLGRRLQAFRPELVSLHAIVEENSPREGSVVSLNLRLPSGQLAARESAPNPLASVKSCFSDLIAQLTAHKELLRNSRGWRRRRGGNGKSAELPGVPFEQTVAAVHPPTASNEDISGYLNANLERLERFIQREIRFREDTGQVTRGAATPTEVLDEVVATALGDGDERPELLTLERWLYRLAIRAIRRVANSNQDEQNNLPLDRSAGTQNVTGSDENVLQFHQPDDMLHGEDVVPDRSGFTPEDIAASDEMVAQLDMALRGLHPAIREAFVLYVLEGFTVPEIAKVTDRKEPDVRNAIQAAHQRIQEKLPVDNALKQQLLRHSKIA